MKIIQVRPGSVRLGVERCAQNLNTQKRQLKHNDEPPPEYQSWEMNYRYYGYNVLGGRYGADTERQWIDQMIRALIEAVNNEPNRWHRLAIRGDSGYQTGSGWVNDGQLTQYPATTLMAFCKDKGVLPEFEQDADGLYVLPFNLPEGASHLEYDDSKPDWDGSGDPVKEQPVLETVSIAPGEEIVILDDWGLPVSATEVV